MAAALPSRESNCRAHGERAPASGVTFQSRCDGTGQRDLPPSAGIAKSRISRAVDMDPCDKHRDRVETDAAPGDDSGKERASVAGFVLAYAVARISSKEIDMTSKALLHTHIDAAIKDRAAAVLEGMGLTVSDAVRILLTRTANEGALPLELFSGSAAHDPWLRAKVAEALHDTRSDVEDANVEAHFEQRHAAAFGMSRRANGEVCLGEICPFRPRQYLRTC